MELSAIQLTYDSDCTHTWTVLLPYTVVRTVDFSFNSVNYNHHQSLFRHHPFVSSLWSTSYNNIIGFELPIDLINYMHARATHSPSASVEAEKRKPEIRIFQKIQGQNVRGEEEEEEVVRG